MRSFFVILLGILHPVLANPVSRSLDDLNADTSPDDLTDDFLTSAALDVSDKAGCTPNASSGMSGENPEGEQNAAIFRRGGGMCQPITIQSPAFITRPTRAKLDDPNYRCKMPDISIFLSCGGREVGKPGYFQNPLKPLMIPFVTDCLEGRFGFQRKIKQMLNRI